MSNLSEAKNAHSAFSHGRGKMLSWENEKNTPRGGY